VRFATAIGQRLKGGWKQAAGATLTVVTLSAVAAVGLTLLVSDVLASRKASENVEPAMASSKITDGPLTFAAPTSTLLRLQAQEKDAQKGNDLASGAPLLVKNWKYTQLPSPQELVQLSWTLFIQATFLAITEEFIDALFPGLASFQQLVDQIFTAFYNSLRAFQGSVNQLIPPAFLQLFPPALRPPTIPPASPHL
jgi:hypothetical protein